MELDGPDKPGKFPVKIAALRIQDQALACWMEVATDCVSDLVHHDTRHQPSETNQVSNAYVYQ